MYTNKERADLINQLTDYLARCDLQGKPVLVAPRMPILSYVTGSKPYLGVIWPQQLSPEKQTNAFAWARQKYAELPLVIHTRVDRTGRNWPLPDPGRIVPGRFTARAALLDVLTLDFIAKNGYTEVWSNAGFAVYKAPNLEQNGEK
jgi:hypothetical protein